MQRPRAQSNSKWGSCGSRESEEDKQLIRVMQKFRSMQPYLKRSLKSIFANGRELELADIVDDIKMYLTIMDDLIAEESIRVIMQWYHGVETINGFIEKIQEIIRSLPYSESDNDASDEEGDGFHPSADAQSAENPQSPRITTEDTESDSETPTEDKDTRHLANDIWNDNMNKKCQYFRRSGDGGETKALNDTENLPGEKFRYGRGRGTPIQKRLSDSDIGNPGENHRDPNEDRRNDRQQLDNQNVNNDNYIRGRGAGRGKIPVQSEFMAHGENRTEKQLPEDRRRNFENDNIDMNATEENFGELDNSLYERRPSRPRPHSASNWDENIFDLNEDPQFENDSFSRHSPGDVLPNWPDSSPKVNSRPTIVPNPNFIPRPTPPPRPHFEFGPRPNVANAFQQPMDNPLVNQNITPAMLKEAMKEVIQEVLGNNMQMPGANNRIMHIPDLNSLFNQNIPISANRPEQNIQNNMGMGFFPQPNRYQEYPPAPANNFRFQNNPGVFRNASPVVNFPPDNNHFDPPESMNDPPAPSQSEINRQFREKARNHFLSPGIRIRPVFGRRNGPPPAPRPVPSTPYRNSPVATNQMQADPPTLDPRLNRARNTPVTNRNEPTVQNEPIDTPDPDPIENEASTSNKRRVGLTNTANVPKTLTVTRKRVIANLPSKKVDRINKLSEFRKQIEKEGVIRLGDKNRKRFQDNPKSPKIISPQNESQLDSDDDQNLQSGSQFRKPALDRGKPKSRSSSKPRNSKSASRSPQKPSDNVRSSLSSKSPIGNADISEDEQGFRTAGTLKLKFKIPKLNKKKPAKIVTEDEAEDLVRKFVLESLSPADLEKLKTNPETLDEIITRLQRTFDEVTTIKIKKSDRPSSSTTRGNSKFTSHSSKQAEKDGTANKPTERPPIKVQLLKRKTFQEIFQETLQDLRNESSNAVSEDRRAKFRNMPKMVKRKGIAYKKAADESQTSKKTVRKATKNVSIKKCNPEAKKVAIKKSANGKRRKSVKSDTQKNTTENCGKEKVGDKTESSSSEPQKRYLTRLQVRMNAKPAPGRSQPRTGWEKWSKKLDVIREKWKKSKESTKKFGEKLRKRKLQLKKQLKRATKRKIGTSENSSNIPLKKPRAVVGPNCIVVNAGLGKIKIESDYLSPVIKTEMDLNVQDCTESADMNHLTFDDNYSQPQENSAIGEPNTDLLTELNQEEYDLQGSTSKVVENENDNENNVGSGESEIPANRLSETEPKNDEIPRDEETNKESLEESSNKEPDIVRNVLSESDMVVVRDRQKKINPDLVDCTLCEFNGKNIVAHYVNRHLGSTIPGACISQETFEKLVEQNKSVSPQLFEIDYTGENENVWPCLYCSRRYDDIREFFDHLTAHTGEFQFACALCSIRYPYFKPMIAHMMSHKLSGPKEVCDNIVLQYKPTVLPDENELFGYLCHDCNYFQLLDVNIARHLETEQHSTAEAISIRFRCPPKQKKSIKKEPDDIKEEIKTEDFMTKANLTEADINMLHDIFKLGSAYFLNEFE